jgi:hypothetical protein
MSTEELCNWLERQTTKLEKERDDLLAKLDEMEKKIDGAMEVIDMVIDNSKMPHKHSDPQLRLYCLTEIASDFLKKCEG